MKLGYLEKHNIRLEILAKIDYFKKDYRKAQYMADKVWMCLSTYWTSKKRIVEERAKSDLLIKFYEWLFWKDYVQNSYTKMTARDFIKLKTKNKCDKESLERLSKK